MSKSMEFWAACVKPGKAVPVTVEEGMTLRLTQVTPARSPLPARLAAREPQFGGAGAPICVHQPARECVLGLTWTAAR